MSIVLGYDESPGSRRALAMAVTSRPAWTSRWSWSSASSHLAAVLGSVSHKLLHISDRPVLCVPGG